jgi:hypothetical protein
MADPETPETPPTTEEGTAVVVAEPAALAAPAADAEPELPQVAEDLVVVAKTREDMEAAQLQLRGWVAQKIAALEQEGVEAQTNLDMAIKRKWATTAFRRALTIVQGRVGYYKRMEAALQAGYIIMPDMPGMTIAVRTSQRKPRHTTRESRAWNTTLPSATSDGSPPGKGRYISPNIKYDTWSQNSAPDAQGRVATKHLARARNFDPEFTFPIKFVKPEIFDETSRAMMHKIFDEIGIIGIGSPKPGERLPSTTVTRVDRDPIVLGRIVRYEGVKRFTCAFLITWWLDTKAL